MLLVAVNDETQTKPVYGEHCEVSKLVLAAIFHHKRVMEQAKYATVLH